MDPGMDNKSFITHLYVTEAEGTRSLYADIGFFMRMELWDQIHVDKWIELSEDCRQNVAGSSDKAQTFFDGIIKEMSNRILLMDIPLRAQMLFNRNLLQEKFSDSPISFVHAMAASLEQENQLISHYRNQMESQSLNSEENPSLINDSAVAESEKVHQEFRFSLQKLSQFKNASPDHYIGGLHTGILPPEGMRQEALDCSHKLLHSLQASWEKVTEMIRIALQADAYRNVSLTPKHSISYEDLSLLCDRYAAILHDVHVLLHQSEYSWMFTSDRKYQEADQILRALIDQFFKRNMIFTKHPKDVILVTNNEKKGEKEVKTETTAASTSAKGKKGQKAVPKDKTKVYDTKKKESIDAKIRIMGLTQMRDAVVTSHSLILTTEQHLASKESSAQKWEFDGAYSPQPQNCGTLYPIPTELPASGEAEFKNLRIEGYERASDSVYEQLVRLQYTVKIQVFGQAYMLRAHSLPFFLCTGAIQVLELLGSRMWYLANNPDLFHGNFQVISTLPVPDVINMLENRIMSTCPKRRRGLSYHGREFLKERIPEIDAQGNMTLHTFIKDKVREVPDTRNSTEEVKYYKFTFFAWFYAFVKSIESHLGLWHDGIVYDLFSFRDSREFLNAETYSSGCALIRPGLSKIIKPNSMDAHIRFTVDMKARSGGRWEVSTIPLDPEMFERSSLCTAISQSAYGNVKPKSICTRKGIVPLSLLENYDDRKGHEEIRYHGFTILKTETVFIKPEGEKTDVATEEDLYTAVPKRKEARYPSTSSLTQPLPSVSPVKPPSAEPNERRPTDTDYPDAVSPNSTTSDCEKPNHSPTNDFNTVKTEFGSNGKWQVYGDNAVDVSCLYNNLQNKVQSMFTLMPSQTSFKGHPTTSPPQTYQRMDYECPEHHAQSPPEHFATHCVEDQSVGIPTTVQEMDDGDQSPTSPEGIDMPVSFVCMEPVLQNLRLNLPPGWTEVDVVDALADQAIPLM